MICRCFCVLGSGLVVVWRGYGYIIAASFPHFVKLDHGVRAMEAVAGHYGRWQDAVTLCSYILEKDNIVPRFLQRIPVAMYFCLNITIYSDLQTLKYDYLSTEFYSCTLRTPA